MGPRANKARALIVQRGHLDLKHPFTGRRAVAENLKNQPGAVEQFHAPSLLKVALLHGRHGAIDQHKVNLRRLHALLKLVDLALAEKHTGMDGAQRHHFGAHDLQLWQRFGQCNGFGQRGLRRAPVVVGLDIRMQHPSARYAGPIAVVDLKCWTAQEASSPS